MDYKISKSAVAIKLTFLYGCVLILIGGLALFNARFSQSDLIIKLLLALVIISAICGGFLYIIFSIGLRHFEESSRVMTVRLSIFMFSMAVLTHGAVLIGNRDWWLIMFPIIILTFVINPFFPALLFAIFFNKDSVKRQFSR